LNLPLVGVQISYYWRYRLLVCNQLLIEQISCSCALAILLNYCLAYVHDDIYFQSCLCAGVSLLKCGFAYVHLVLYWAVLLLMCNVLIIEIDWLLMCSKAFIDCAYCWCAGASLLSKFIADVQLYILLNFLSCLCARY